jgi:virginiamycin A acetyltransferase
MIRRGENVMNLWIVVKNAALIISFVIVSPLIVMSKIEQILLGSEELFQTFTQLISLVPGKTGIYLRSAFYRFTLEEYHLSTYILFGSIISKTKTKIKRNCGIGAYSLIGLAEIGENVGIGSRVSIMSGRYQHNFKNPDEGFNKGDDTYICTRIGKNSFVGEQSVVMADIGESSIVGAGSIVVKPIPPYSIAVGNPAKVVKDRRN